MTYLILLLSLFSLPVFAGKEAGGGNVVVCFYTSDIAPAIRDKYKNVIPDRYLIDHYVESIETVDYYLAKKDKGLLTPIKSEIIEAMEGEGPYEYVERIASRYDKTASGLADLLRKGVKRFVDSRITREPKGISFTPDSGLVAQIDNEKCVLATMGFQYNTSLDPSEDNFYLHVDTRLWTHPKHSQTSKNVFLEHEGVWSFDRVRQLAVCRNLKEGVQDCLDRINSRNSWLLVGETIRTKPPLTLFALAREFQSLGFGTTTYNYYDGYDDSHSLLFSYPHRVMLDLVGKWKKNILDAVEKAEDPMKWKSLKDEFSHLKRERDEMNLPVYMDINCETYYFGCDYDTTLEQTKRLVDKRDPRIRQFYDRLVLHVKNVADARELIAKEIEDQLPDFVETIAKPAIRDIPYMREDQKPLLVEMFEKGNAEFLKELRGDIKARSYVIGALKGPARAVWVRLLTKVEIDLNYPIP